MILFGGKLGKRLPGMGFLLLLAALLSLAACTARTTVANRLAPYAQTTEIENAGQVLLVTDESFLLFTSHKIYPLEKTNASWQQAMAPMDAVIGRNGVAPPGEKREGDGRTPSGLFRLKTAFGYPPSVPSQMPYRQSQEDDLWIDDSNDALWVLLRVSAGVGYWLLLGTVDPYSYGTEADETLVTEASETMILQ